MNLYGNVVAIRLRITIPQESITDSNLTKELCEKLRAQTSHLSVQKKLMDLSAVKQWSNKARRYIKKVGIPWTAEEKSDPLWAISGRQIKDVMATIADYREEFFDAAHTEVQQYETIIKVAEDHLGNAFNPMDFPSKEDFANRFSWDTEIQPVRDLGDMEMDFRYTLPQHMVSDQIKIAERDMKSRVRNCVCEILTRTQERIASLADGLDDYEPGEDRRKGNTFRDVSIYARLDEHREWILTMNEFLEDQDLVRIASKIESFSSNVRPDDPNLIREDERTRQRVASSLRGIAQEARRVVERA